MAPLGRDRLRVGLARVLLGRTRFALSGGTVVVLRRCRLTSAGRFLVRIARCLSVRGAWFGLLLGAVLPGRRFLVGLFLRFFLRFGRLFFGRLSLVCGRFVRVFRRVLRRFLRRFFGGGRLVFLVVGGRAVLVLLGGRELDVPHGRLLLGAGERDLRAGRVGLRRGGELGRGGAGRVLLVFGAGRVRFPLGVVVHVPALLDSNPKQAGGAVPPTTPRTVKDAKFTGKVRGGSRSKRPCP
jgi:hypothetical protein